MTVSMLLPGCALVLVGIVGVLARRSLLSVLLSFNVGVVGACLLLASAEAEHPKGLVAAFVVAGCGLWVSLCGGAVALAVYRRKGTLHVDELREMRG